MHDRAPIALQLERAIHPNIGSDGGLAKKIDRPHAHSLPTDHTGHAAAGRGLEFTHFWPFDFAFNRGLKNRISERVLADVLDGRAETQNFHLTERLGRMHIGQLRPPFSDRSRLIDDEHIDSFIGRDYRELAAEAHKAIA